MILFRGLLSIGLALVCVSMLAVALTVPMIVATMPFLAAVVAGVLTWLAWPKRRKA